ncbi:unnamed protein product, partial [Gongylonema pulchrum]|uniref:Transcriptional regulator n=1 Tax=Gongylonema pulchrum TaxID=637853 RepID=A0A183DEE1_9BILA
MAALEPVALARGLSVTHSVPNASESRSIALFSRPGNQHGNEFGFDAIADDSDLLE